jgi:hypothetical protein
MRILGIDPGKTGAWCLLDTLENSAEAGRLKWTEDGIFDLGNIDRFWDYVIIEKVKAIPHKMGASSAFTFGMGYGQLLYAFSNYGTTLVSPKTWQSVCLTGIDTDLNPKLRSQAGFARLNPELKTLKIDHNITDAFHLANYGVRQHGLNHGQWQWQNLDGISKKSKKS